MWLFTQYGFYSVVKDRHGENAHDPDALVIRARRRTDLETLINADYNVGPILEFAGTDYPYRVNAHRRVVAQIAADTVNDIDYTNYKDRVHDNDPTRASIYGRVWSDLLALEEDRKQGWRLAEWDEYDAWEEEQRSFFSPEDYEVYEVHDAATDAWTNDVPTADAYGHGDACQRLYEMDDGDVAVCELSGGHNGPHFDTMLDVNWTDGAVVAA